jgi:predicted HicB family RNase H-like nuclease
MSAINLRNIPDELHRKIKAEAALQGITLEQLIVKIMQEYLEKNRRK